MLFRSDGILSGIDEKGTAEIAKNIKIPIIASGGVSSLLDLEKVKDSEVHGVSGVIIGRAFYDNKISYSDAIKYQNN